MQTRRTFVNSLFGVGISLPVMRSDAFRRLVNAEGVGGATAPNMLKTPI